MTGRLMIKPMIVVVALCVMCKVSIAQSQNESQDGWDLDAAASYLDQRVEWWSGWERAERDQETFCISCHTTGPFGLARSRLRPSSDYATATRYERVVLQNIRTRVSHWDEFGPYYGDEQYGALKTAQSRGTEAIWNALVLANQDASTGSLSSYSEAAFDRLWALQETSGEDRGAWRWLHFGLAPWESDEGTYFGAALAAVAVGLAPSGYRTRPEIQEALTLLRDYLRKQVDAEPLLNRVMAVWASASGLDFLAPNRQRDILSEIVTRQRSDGGWSLSSLGSWKRRDGSRLERVSDGYATGLIVLALQSARLADANKVVANGLSWLRSNQLSDGSWPALSLNRFHESSSDSERFMRDAATSFAVLALTTGGEFFSSTAELP